MKKVIYIFMFVQASVFSQSLDSNVIEELQKNLMAYQIRYLTDDIFCLGSFEDQIGEVFLKKNEEYDFDYYPVTDFNYPNKKYDLFVIFNNFYAKKLVNENNKEVIEFTHSMGHKDRISSKALIGISKTNQIYYIAGPLFKNCISQDFNLNVLNGDSFIDFLKLKLFNYKVNRIRLKRKRKKYLLFSAHSEALKDDVFIKINSRDFDDIEVKGVSSGWTERGSYSWYKK